MKLHFQRSVETTISREMLALRLAEWADVTGFSCSLASPPRWEFWRGSWWHALYSFDIRKWPTRAAVVIQGVEPMQVQCSIQFKCWWTVPQAKDEFSLSDDFELLLAFVCETRPSAWRMVSDQEAR